MRSKEVPHPISQLTSRIEDREKITTKRSFFDYYFEVPALFKKTQKPGHTIKLFQDAVHDLGIKLKNSYSGLGRSGSDPKPIADYHALLALIHWLYPSNEKLSR